MAYYHTCPYCGTQLSVNKIPAESSVSRCPHCHKTFIFLEHGAVLKELSVYRFLKCVKEVIYNLGPLFVRCDECNSLFIRSKHGNCKNSTDLLGLEGKEELVYQKKRDRVAEFRKGWHLMSKGRKNSIFACIAFICLGTYIYSLPPAIEKSLAYADMENVWKEFRQKNPYNIQIEGLKRYEDNSYVAIISEPNEKVSVKDLKHFFKKYNCEFRTDTTKLGYDGWLCDAVVSFNDLDEDDVPKLAAKLSKLLYGTDYKASFLDLNTIPEHTAFSSFDLNGQVTEEELRKWFIEDREQLVNYDDEEDVTTLPDIFTNSAGETQLYYSKESGFVVWTFAEGECDRDEFLVAARKFSLDSDLIFGAIKSQSTIAVIARERCVPLYELPPMRQETLCLLAGTQESELAQSYERTSLFAGKQKGGKDYAPIYLSDELWHTEYGNILNVTDQMLKSWSENGMIDYVDFDYPKPSSWAFNAGAVKDLKVSTLTYNWNTKGVGYIVEDDNYDIYALNRTGSLPVSYILGKSEGLSSSDPVYQAEQLAYDFFSNLSTPELVKVVQYTAMYQIFRNLGINIKGEKKEITNAICPPKKLIEARDSMLHIFTHRDTRKIAKEYGFKVVKYDEAKSYRTKILISSEGSQRFSSFPGYYSYFKFLVTDREDTTIEKKFIECGILLRSLEEIQDPESYLDSYLNRQDFLGKSNIIEDEMRLHSSVYQNYFSMHCGISTEERKKMYVYANKDKNSTWMKCPTIVESWQLADSAYAVGGHNLNSKVTRFKVDRGMRTGEVEVGENGVIRISAKDRMSRVSNQDYLRKVGRLGDNSLGEVVPIRPKSEAVGIASQRTARGFNGTDHLTVSVDRKKGLLIGDKKYSTLDELINDLGTHVHEGNSQSKTLEIQGVSSKHEVKVLLNNVSGYLHKGQAVNIPIERYDFSNPTISIEGDKAYVTIPIKAGTIEFGSTSSVMEAGFGGFSNLKPKLTVKGGEAIFKMPKQKVNAFMEMIRDYVSKQRGVWNSFKIKMEMKKRGIDPNSVDDLHNLKIAKICIDSNNNYFSVWASQETKIA